MRIDNLPIALLNTAKVNRFISTQFNRYLLPFEVLASRCHLGPELYQPATLEEQKHKTVLANALIRTVQLVDGDMSGRFKREPWCETFMASPPQWAADAANTLGFRSVQWRFRGLNYQICHASNGITSLPNNLFA